MVNVLAFDTALAACSAALLDNDTVVAARWEPLARGHAERLVPMLQEVLADAGASFADLDLICLTTGPGTFTGVRVGLAVARGLALTHATPVLALGTLDAIARGAGPDQRILVILDARREQVYGQAFGPGFEAVTPPQLIALSNVAEMASGAGVVLGSGAELALPYIAAAGASYVLSSAAALPDATCFAIGAWQRLAEARDAGPPTPLYLRAPDAKLPEKAGG